MNLYNKEHFAGIERGWRSQRWWLHACKIAHEGKFHLGCLAIYHAVRMDDPKGFNAIFIPNLIKFSAQLKDLKQEPYRYKLDDLVWDIFDTAAKLLGHQAHLMHFNGMEYAGKYPHYIIEQMAYAICHLIGLAALPW